MRSTNLVLVTVFSMCCVGLAQNSQEDFLEAHNKAREEVGVAPLIWDETVAESAKAYAQKVIKDCPHVAHSGGYYGENLVVRSTDLTAKEAVDYWLAEKADYDHDSNSCINDAECKHYTQAVWGETFNLGCAKEKCDNGWTFVICHYDPPGNFVGLKPY